MRTAWRQGLAAIALVLAGGPGQPAPAAPPTAEAVFQDVPPGHWAAEGALGLYLLGAVRGDGSGLFRPEQPVTRAEAVAMGLRAMGIVPGGPCARVFPDTPCEAWYRPAAETAYRLLLLDGGPTGFDPQAPLSRQEGMALAVRLAGRVGEARALDPQAVGRTLAAFADGEAVGASVRGAVAWLVRQGIVGGHAGRLDPGEPLTRGQAACLFYRLAASRAGPVRVEEVDGFPIRYRRALDMIASKYSAGEPGVGTMTATGVRVREGIVAVDPRVIPLGSRLYVEGYGYGVAADTGGAIRGNRIDLYTSDVREAMYRFGLRPVRVYLLDG